jgi:hypothetical protein
MRLARLLADPWTIGAGTFLGAVAGLGGLGIGALPAVAIGVGGYAVGTAVKALTSRDEPSASPAPGVVLPPRGTEARTLHDRAWAAVADLGEIASSQQAGPLRAQALSVHEQARDALDGIGRIAAQTVVLREALARVDVAQVQRDALRLEQVQGEGGHEESLAAVRSRLAVAGRLEKAARAADSRLLSAALGLESLVASMAEVVAMTGGTGDDDRDAGARIRGLADQLGGLREGLAEAEETSRRALTS